MSDSATKDQESQTNDSKGKTLAQIEPVKAHKDNQAKANVSKQHAALDEESVEKSLIAATQDLLKQHGIRKSRAAIRNAVEMPHERFMPSE